VKTSTKSPHLIINAVLCFAAIAVFTHVAVAQTHLYQATDVVNVTSYSSIYQAAATVPPGTSSLNVAMNPALYPSIHWNDQRHLDKLRDMPAREAI
jgi:hypothetical protein